MADMKQHLVRYLHQGRDALLWKLDGLDDYDVRRPLVPTGTNLLGLVKHVAATASGYFGHVFDRPFDEVLWMYAQDDLLIDLWCPADESRDDVLGLWERAWAHSDATISELPLDAPGRVPWWPDERADVTLGQILLHMTAELNRHAGHADIVRELIDGAAGLRPDATNLPDGQDWQAHYDRVEAAARASR